MIARWRLAARLARREVRRHLARSLLVVLIITLPVLAAQAGVLAWRSAQTINDDLIAEYQDDGWHGDAQMAGADEMVGYDPRLGRPETPPGTDREATGFLISDWTQARDGRGDGPDDLADVHLVAHLPEGEVPDIAVGTAPTTRREVLIGAELAAETGLGPDDIMTVEGSRIDLTVTGVADTGRALEPFAWVGPPVDGDDWVPDTVVRLRETGSELISAELFALYWRAPIVEEPTEQTTIDGDAWARADRRDRVEAVVVTAAVTTMVVGFVAITCSSAFAIGARRQLRQLGTMSAAGASPADLRRAVLLQGTTLGLAGAAVATTIVYALRALAVDRLDDRGPWLWYRQPVGRRWDIPLSPGWVLGVAALGVLAGTCAALVPAFTASRIPVLNALAGRRPVRTRPMRSPIVGAVMLVGGLALLSWSTAAAYDTASRNVFVVVAVLLTMIGTVALAPAVVAAVSGLAARLGGTTRLAGRSLIRNSMRTGAVVATTAVAVALPAIVLVYEARELDHSSLSDEVQDQRDAVEDALREVGQVNVGGGEAGTEVAAEVGDIIGTDDVVVADQLHTRLGGSLADAYAVDPEQLRRVTGDDAVADALARGDIVTIGRVRSGIGRTWGLWGIDTSDPSNEVLLDEHEVTTVDREGVSPLTFLLLDQVEHGIVARSDDQPDHPPTIFAKTGGFGDEQVQAIYAIQEDPWTPTLASLRELAPTGDATVDVIVSDTEGRDLSPTPFVVLGAAVLALAVIGTAMALAAADGRSDDQVVAAVGAPPGVIRRRVLEAAMTAGSASILGVVVGATATLVVIHNPGIDDAELARPIHLPILEVVGTAGGIVALVGGATWLVLAIGARLRGRSDLFLVDG